MPLQGVALPLFISPTCTRFRWLSDLKCSAVSLALLKMIPQTSHVYLGWLRRRPVKGLTNGERS